MVDQLTECRICPRECGVNRTLGAIGVCGCTNDMRISRVSLHHWEEPSISGDTGSGTIFFAGCNLRCCYCQNRQISLGAMDEVGRVYSVDDLASAMLSLEREQAMNINFVTPTHFAPQIRKAIALAQTQGLSIPIIWNTSGYELVSQIGLNKQLVDVYLTDFKYASNELAKALSSASDYPDVATDALREMVLATGDCEFDEYHGCERLISGVVVRHMLLPGHLDDSKAVIAKLWSEFGNSIRLSLMNQYTPVLTTDAEMGIHRAQVALKAHPELADVVISEDYERMLDFADSLGVESYYWQEGEACKESFIPDFE